MRFSQIDHISFWKARVWEVRYCLLTEREYVVAEHLWPSRYLEGRFVVFVN